MEVRTLIIINMDSTGARINTWIALEKFALKTVDRNAEPTMQILVVCVSFVRIF